ADYAHLLEDLGALHSLRGEFSEAAKDFRKALEIFDDGTTEQAVALNNLGMACIDVGRFEEATGYLSRALKIWETFGDASGLNTTVTEHSLAVADVRVGKTALAA